MAKKKNEIFEWIKVIVLALGLAAVVRFFLFEPIVVDGPSMLPTLHDGDQAVVNKFVYNIKEPERFDIIVFHASEQRDFIKRVIGLPGEHIAVRDDVLYVNGEPVNEPFIDERKDFEAYQAYTKDFSLEQLPGEYDIIPEGYVLVLGDNRTNSTDSRMMGLISMDEIVGKAIFIYLPFDRIQLVN